MRTVHKAVQKEVWREEGSPCAEWFLRHTQHPAAEAFFHVYSHFERMCMLQMLSVAGNGVVSYRHHDMIVDALDPSRVVAEVNAKLLSLKGVQVETVPLQGSGAAAQLLKIDVSTPATMYWEEFFALRAQCLESLQQRRAHRNLELFARLIASTLDCQEVWRSCDGTLGFALLPCC